jgi:hypothetical protein
LMATVTVWPPLPPKLTRAFWPGTVVATVTAGPPIEVAGRDRREHGIDVPELLLRDRADPRERTRTVACREATLEPDDELAGYGLRDAGRC